MIATKVLPCLSRGAARMIAGLAMLTLGGVAFSATPASYLKGTFQIVDFTTSQGSPPVTRSTWATATFDGVGNVSFTGLLDTDTAAARDVITSTSGSDTYQVAADGTITWGTQGTTGRLSGDGNILIISAPAVNDAPEILVGIRIGSISGLNTATGQLALNSNTTGSDNTASGSQALFSNTIGAGNTATGYQALYTNTSGTSNVAVGDLALFSNTTGGNNTAAGAASLYGNTTGASNSAFGLEALTSNTTGANNTAFGYQAMANSLTGGGNAAQGNWALYLNTTGARNVAVGNYALQRNTRGSYNTSIGWNAGSNLTTGNDNIDIASFGVAAESQTMRLGRQGTASTIGSGITRTFIAGVSGVTTGLAGSAVVIDANGQLGTISSSRRYKQDIQPMADASERLMNLRPVKFRYKQADARGERPVQYGLIAEEVAEAFPELVVRNKEGQPETVAYHLLPALLLNELQKDHRLNLQHTEKLAEVTELKQRLAVLDARLAAQTELLAHVQELLAARAPAAKVSQVAMR